MVWSTTQSALYNDLSRYYEEDKRPGKSSEKPDNFKTEFEENCCGKLPEKRSQNCGKKCPENQDKNFSNTSENHDKKCGNKFVKCTEKYCEEKNPPVCPNCPHIRQDRGDQISRIISDKFSDKDMLLIAGLIFLLMKQGADRQLILALAFVLLS